MHKNNFSFSFKHIILRETINFIEYTAMKNEKKKKMRNKGRRKKEIKFIQTTVSLLYCFYATFSCRFYGTFHLCFFAFLGEVIFILKMTLEASHCKAFYLQ